MTRIAEVQQATSFLEWLKELESSVLCRFSSHFHAAYLMYGAISELSTLEGYGMLANKTRNPFAEVDLSGKLSTVGLRHDFLVSTEYLRSSNFYECWCYGSGTIDVTDPVYQPVSNFFTPSSTPPAFGYSGGNRWGSGILQDRSPLGSGALAGWPAF